MSESAASVALVTGGSRGLGSEICVSLLEQGWRVVSVSRHGSPATDAQLTAYPAHFSSELTDLKEAGAAKEVVRAATKRFGRVDALVNNMGTLRQELFLTMNQATVQSQIETNLLAPFYVAQACARSMSASGGGAIVNISSINAVRGFGGVSAYSAAKAGLDGLTRSLARELGPLSIRVNSVVPGYFESALSSGVIESNKERIRRRTPLGRLGTTQDACAAVMFLLANAASFITGQTLVIDGGLTC